MITCIIWPLHLVLTLLVVNLWRKCAQPKPPGEEGKKMVHWAADYGGIHEFDSENSDTKTLSSSQPSSMISLSSPVDDQDPVSEGGFRRHSGSVSAHKRSFSSPNKQSGSRITRLNTPSRSMGMMNMDEIALTDEFANPLSPGQSQGPDRHGWRGSGSVVRVHNNNNNNNNNNGGESGSRSPLHVKRHSNSSSSNHAPTVQHHQQQQRIQSPVIPYKLDILKKKKHSRSKPA
jgi:hypothetical protein